MSANIPNSDNRRLSQGFPINTHPTDDALDMARCEHVLRVVASYFGVPTVELLAPTRRKRPIAYARQMAMYLAHTHYQLPMSAIARAMGRDRSTVGFGCRRIEDMRDDERTDTIVSCLELLLSNGDMPTSVVPAIKGASQ